MHVAERIGAEQYEVARLLEFATRRIYIGHALGSRLGRVEVDLHDARVGAHLDVVLLRSKRDDREMRARLGVHLTAETLAIAAVVAGAEGDAVGIDVGLRHVGGRSWKGVITQAFCSLLEQRSRVGLNHRRVGIFALARSLKHVAALDLLSAQSAGLA